ncbi:MAG: type II secretion system secretin GspD [Deltaproteobacteria bacterium]|nr:type II secretion system secretin GspD [Deltaproteobacteria bacterium]
MLEATRKKDPVIPLVPPKDLKKPGSLTPRPGKGDAKAAATTAVPAKKPGDAKAGGPPIPAPSSGGPLPETDYPKNIKHNPKFPKNVAFSFDLPKEDLEAVVKWISDLTGKNFILTEKVKGRKISIFSPRKVRIGEAWKAFLSALEVNGLTVVPSGNYLKLVEQRDANQMPITTLPDKEPVPDDDRFLTRLIPVKHVELAEIQNVINKLKGRGSDLTPYAPTNTLILSDTAANIRRILKIIERLDVPTGGRERIFLRKIKHATASDIASKLNELFGDKSGKKPRGQAQPVTPHAPPTPGRPPPPPAPQPPPTPGTTPAMLPPEADEDVRVSKIISDERTNMLIIVAQDRAYSKVVQLIKELDIPLPGGEGRVRVHYLENAEAEEMATVLASLAAGSAKTGPRPPTAPGAKGAAAGASLFEGELKITADKATNSLIIIGTEKDYRALKDIIAKLDMRRNQVFVETVIMEVAIDRQKDQKVSFTGGKGFSVNGQTVPLMFGNNPADTLFLTPAALTGFGAILRGPDVPGTTGALGSSTTTTSTTGTFSLGTGIPSFGAFLQFLQSNQDTNVLSTPHILATDNKDAELTVGEKVPFISGATTSLGALAGAAGGLPGLLTTSVTREDVSLKLSIKPRINESSYVTMDVNNEISELGAVEPTTNQPKTTKRTVKTTVIVKDGSTIVVGGLMKNIVSEGSSKIPILGDIPVLGFFFRKKNNRMAKTNLLIFLTPHIIRTPQDFRRIFEKKMQERQEFLEKFSKAGIDSPFTVDYGKKHGPLEEVNQYGGKFEEAIRDQERMDKEAKEAQDKRDELKGKKKKKKGPAPLLGPDGKPVKGGETKGVPDPKADPPVREGFVVTDDGEE